MIDGRLEDAWYVAEPLMITGLSQVVLVNNKGKADLADVDVNQVWKGPQTLSGKIYLLMDEANLYLGADVTDDHPMVNQGTKGGVFDGTSLELYFGGRDRRDHPELTTPGYAPFEYQVELALDREGQPTIWFGPQAPSSERGASNGPAVGGELAAQKKPDGSGYVLEAKIPLTNFRFTPKAGQKIELDVGLNRAAAQPGAGGKIHRELQMMWHGEAGNFEKSNAWGRAYVWMLPLPGQEAAAAPVPQVQAQVRVRGDTAWQINGHREIPRDIFGARVQGNTKSNQDVAEMVRWLQEAGFESFFYYIYPQGASKEWEDPARPGHPKAELYEHPDRVWGQNWQLTDAAYENLRQVSPEGNYCLCLQSCPPWMALNPVGNHVPVPSDPGDYARMSSALIQLLRSDPRGPGKFARYISFMNEPEYIFDWDSQNFSPDPTMPTDHLLGEKGLAYYIQCYRAMAQQVKADFPDLLVGGPVAHGPLQMLDWWGWKNWTIKFLDQTGPLCDFYDFHPYADWNNDRASIQAMMTMVMNHVLLTQGRPMPCLFSEQNYYGTAALVNDPGQRFQQLLWNQRVLFMEMDESDKTLGHYYFLVFDNRVYDWGLQVSNLFQAVDGKWVPYPVLYLYRGMRELRGTRLYAESSRPEVMVRAAQNGARLSVLVFNDARQQAAVSLDLALPAGARVVRTLGSGWSYDRDKNEFAHYEDKEVAATPAGGVLRLPVDLAPFASQSFVVELADPPQSARSAETTEYYADRIFAEQAAETRPVFSIALPASARGAQRLTLSLGWEGPKPEAVLVGTARYPVPDQRPEITDIKVAEIPLQAADVAAVTEVRPVYGQTYPDFNEKILFATITTTEVKQ